jgi:hypothetical protein
LHHNNTHMTHSGIVFHSPPLPQSILVTLCTCASMSDHSHLLLCPPHSPP